MVPIFTYRDERKLFAIVGAIIAAALLALLQLDFARSGRPSPLTTAVTSLTAYAQLAISTIVDGARGASDAVVHAPSLARDNGRLRDENAALRRKIDELEEALARAPALASIERAKVAHPDGIGATVIGFDPESTTRVVTIDRGSTSGVRRDDGVVTGEGVVGRVVEASPLSAKVLLVTDPSSKLPAVVQRGRHWAIAVGTATRVKLQYVSQDAKLKPGDRVVTGEGRSFHAGVLIGTIVSVEPLTAGALDRSAIVQPAADLSALSHVVVIPQQTVSQH